MKQSIFLTAFLFLFAAAGFAQNEKYYKAMGERVAQVESVREPAALKDLSAAFERIGDAEKNQWLPYYYAALTQANAGMFSINGLEGGKAGQVDPIADKAEQLLDKAEALSKDNSEIYIVRKMIASLRMMADPQSRYMTFGPKAAEALAMAKKLNPENPRVYLLEGQDKFFTPEQYGGSKEEAKKLFEAAMQKFATFKPVTPLDPSWGQGTTQYFMGQLK